MTDNAPIQVDVDVDDDDDQECQCVNYDDHVNILYEMNNCFPRRQAPGLCLGLEQGGMNLH